MYSNAVELRKSAKLKDLLRARDTQQMKLNLQKISDGLRHTIQRYEITHAAGIEFIENCYFCLEACLVRAQNASDDRSQPVTYPVRRRKLLMFIN